MAEVDAAAPVEFQPLSAETLDRLRARFAAEKPQRALDPAIALRLIDQAKQAVAPIPAAYKVEAPLSRASGYCTAECKYDANGVCRVCGCFDPRRFVLLEYPTEKEDEMRKLAQKVEEAGGTLHAF